MKCLIIALSLLVNFLQNPVLAGEALFGGELTFTNDEILAEKIDDTWVISEATQKYQMQMRDRIKQKCAQSGCKMRYTVDPIV